LRFIRVPTPSSSSSSSSFLSVNPITTPFLIPPVVFSFLTSSRAPSALKEALQLIKPNKKTSQQQNCIMAPHVVVETNIELGPAIKAAKQEL